MENKLLALVPLIIAYGTMACMTFWFFKKGKRSSLIKGNFTFRAIISLFWYSLSLLTALLLATLALSTQQTYRSAIVLLEYYDSVGIEIESRFSEGEDLKLKKTNDE